VAKVLLNPFGTIERRISAHLLVRECAKWISRVAVSSSTRFTATSTRSARSRRAKVRLLRVHLFAVTPIRAEHVGKFRPSEPVAEPIFIHSAHIKLELFTRAQLAVPTHNAKMRVAECRFKFRHTLDWDIDCEKRLFYCRRKRTYFSASMIRVPVCAECKKLYHTTLVSRFFSPGYNKITEYKNKRIDIVLHKSGIIFGIRVFA
jgi:hypothetical protein